MNRIKQIINNIKIDKIYEYVLLVYFVVCLLPYVFAPIPSLYWFFCSTFVNLTLRLLSSLLLVVFSIIVFIQRRPRIDRVYLIASSFLLLILLLSIIITPNSFSSIIPSKGYAYSTFVNYKVGLIDIFGGFASCIIDIIFGFLFLFVLPCVSNKQVIKKLLLFVFLFMLFECSYSIVVERQKYINTLFGNNSAYSGYEINISGTFISKNQFGAFLIMGFISGFIFLNWFSNKKIIKVLSIIGLIFIIFVIIASLCKTALISLILFGLFYLIFLFRYLLNHKKIKTLLIVSSIIVFFVVFILMLFCTGLGNLKPFSGLRYFITSLLYKTLGKALEERFLTWAASLSVFNGYHVVLGYPKASLPYALMIGTLGNNSVSHNGFIQQLLYYGIFGLLFLFYVYYILICRYKNAGMSHKDKSIYLATLFAVFAFMLTETEILIVSSSLLVFIFNVLFSTIPIRNLKDGYYEVKI